MMKRTLRIALTPFMLIARLVLGWLRSSLLLSRRLLD